jgi:murein DD-endopeptidase MepM/ murein hydrolase activator NlpD
VRFVAADGTKAYYTPQGLSLRKAFIRTPVDFTRISSGFTMHRWHPILNMMRAHTGTDYAAPIGTPVHASGNGRVEFIGQKGGYGNVVILRHGAQYETVYGHLSRFQSGLHTGSPVQQGQVIAYVGMTGLATGPHLHYEFRVNGMPVNAEKVILPRSMPLEPKVLAQFRNTAAPLLTALDTIDVKSRVAQVNSSDLNATQRAAGAQ